MDDMNAFERQVAGRIEHLVGPVRPVDDLSVYDAIIATRSPKWRFQSMFSATKFVVAGAIVALFGGFLLSGVLMQQPAEETAPIVGASASARPTNWEPPLSKTATTSKTCTPRSLTAWDSIPTT